MTSDQIRRIDSLLQHQIDAARAGDAHGAALGFADDADWINAFGVRLRGRRAIEAFLVRVLPTGAGATTTVDPPEIRLIRHDVAIAHRHVRAGERSAHLVSVLVERAGEWAITYHVIMDERAR